MKLHEVLQIPKRKGQYVKGKKDLFAVVIIFKYMGFPGNWESIMQIKKRGLAP